MNRNTHFSWVPLSASLVAFRCIYICICKTDLWALVVIIRLFDPLPLISTILTTTTTTTVIVMHRVSITLTSLVLLVFSQRVFSALFPTPHSLITPLHLPPYLTSPYHRIVALYLFLYFISFTSSFLLLLLIWLIAKFTLDQSHFISVFEPSQNCLYLNGPF